jgi:hypothetical protein
MGFDTLPTSDAKKVILDAKISSRPRYLGDGDVFLRFGKEKFVAGTQEYQTPKDRRQRSCFRSGKQKHGKKKDRQQKNGPEQEF